MDPPRIENASGEAIGRRLSPTLLGLAAGFVTALVFGLLLMDGIAAHDRATQSSVDAAARSIERGVEQAALKLETVDGLFRASDDISAQDFAAFADSLNLDRDPDSVAVALRVAGSDLEEFRVALGSMYGDVEFFQLAGEHRIALRPGREHYIVAYHQPAPGLPSNVGFDALSQDVRRDAIIVATSTDTTVVSSFVQPLNSAERDGFIMVHPVHDPSGETIGVAVAGGSASSMVASWVADQVQTQLRLTVVSPEHPEIPSSGWLQPAATSVVELPGRTWILAGIPYEASRSLATLLVVGIGSSIVVGLGTATLVHTVISRRRLERNLTTSARIAQEREEKIEALSAFELLARNSTDIIVRADSDLSVLYVSPAIESLLGIPAWIAIGQKPLDHFHPDDQRVARETVEELVSGAPTVSMEHRFRHADGRWLWFHTTARAIRDDEGDLVEVQSASRDVTAQVEQRRALVEARAETERAAAEKAQFLATVSHEIRTPLNAVAGLSELLTHSTLDEEQREYVATIQSASRTVVSIITDLLDLSKAEVGKLRISHVPLDVRDAISSVVHLLEATATSRGLILRSEVDQAVPEVIMGDPHRLHQILVNLVGNALKFTEKGSVTLRAGCRLGAAGERRLRMEVIDTGVGIPADRLEAIFEAFEQADASTAGRFGGTGLGLGISLHLVQLMGGTIGVVSTEGDGSTFWFDLPLLAPDPDSITRCVVAGLPQDRVRLVPLLRAAGWLVDERDQVQAGEEVQVMVGAAGDLDPTLSLTGVLVVDSDPHRGNSALVEARGAAGYLGTPITAEELADVLARCRAGAFVTRHSSDAGGGQLRILAADDSASNRLLVEKLLTRRGHRVDVVEDGTAAIEAYESARYDVVVVDGRMPGISGLEVASAIRSREAGSGRHTRIVLLTGLDSHTDMAAAHAAGVDVCLLKPVDVDQLHRAVEGDAAAPPSALPPLDLSGLWTQFEGMPELADELLGVVREEWRELAHRFTAAAVESDLEAAGAAAHRLKGAVGFFGDEATIEAAASLERSAKAGDRNASRDAALVLVARMEELDALVAELLTAGAHPNR